MGKLKVRLAKKSELASVNDLRRQVHALHVKGRPDIFRRKFGKKLAAHIRTYFRGEMTRIVVAKSDGVICGYAVLEMIRRPRTPYNNARSFLKITEIGVDKLHRRKGVGRALLEFIRHYAAENGWNTVELDVWEFNSDALRFYESMGFTTYRRFLELKV